MLRLLWLATLVLFGAIALFPASYRFTRAGGLVLFFVVWFGLVFLYWHRRGEYVAGLRRYEGVTYFWGGESPKGIDCSGLIRRGLIDSLFYRGIRTFDPGLVRHALSLWWHDCTASALGETHDGLTVHLLDTPSVNQLDHSRILPGDLAVTSSGVHIMAYLGNNTWIEADPGVGRVISVPVPARGNSWFDTSMKIVRWRVLSQ